MRIVAALLLACATAAGSATRDADPRRPGFDDLGPALQALQRDDTQNPAMLWVSEGRALWTRVPQQGRACVDCHAADSLPGIAASYPRLDPAAPRPLTLSARIDRCRVQHQNARPEGPDGDEVLAFAAYLAFASRGRPLKPDADRRLDAWQARGEALYRQRLGQLDLACLHCHDQRAGGRLGGARIPQAHPTGYPAYRLEWQALGSLERRLHNCVTGVRAEPWAPAADEWLALQVYLARRAAGLLHEGPSVRP